MNRKNSLSNTFKRTKFGDFMFKITVKAGLFLAHHKVLYYILSYTWGILTTLAGWVMLGFGILFNKKTLVEKGKFFTAHYAIFGKNWGGVGVGTSFMVSGNMSKDYTTHCKCHELGYTYQAAVWGPFVLIFFYLPSLVRCWCHNVRSKKNLPTQPYDLIYFEGSASEIGQTLLSEKEGKDYTYYTPEFKKNPNFGKKLQKETTTNE